MSPRYALYQDGSTVGGENALNNVGIDWSAFEAGGDLETDNGTWFVTPDKQQGEAIDHGGDIGYGVLIAQVTTTDNGGTFSGLLQGKDATATHGQRMSAVLPTAVATFLPQVPWHFSASLALPAVAAVVRLSDHRSSLRGFTAP